MTVTNYFPRKEDLAIDRHEEIASGLATVAARRQPGQSVLAAVRTAYATGLAHSDTVLSAGEWPSAGGVPDGRWARMVAESPALRARLRELFEQREEALADVLIGPAGADEVFPRLAAAMIAGADRVLFGLALRLARDGRDDDEILAALAVAAEEAFDLLEQPLEGL
jgi:AcrR family transcriptional regulator